MVDSDDMLNSLNQQSHRNPSAACSLSGLRSGTNQSNHHPLNHFLCFIFHPFSSLSLLAKAREVATRSPCMASLARNSRMQLRSTARPSRFREKGVRPEPGGHRPLGSSGSSARHPHPCPIFENGGGGQKEPVGWAHSGL